MSFRKTRTDGTCEIDVNRSGSSRWSSFQPCGRKAVQDGLCSLHLKVAERRRDKDRAYDERRKRDDALTAEAKKLSNLLGVEVRAVYNPWAKGGGAYTGAFTVPGDWLREQAGLQ